MASIQPRLLQLDEIGEANGKEFSRGFRKSAMMHGLL
jgi:hypothetical protein